MSSDISWDDLIQRLAMRLPRLGLDDLVILSFGEYFVQFYQDPDHLLLQAVSNADGYPTIPLTPEQEDQLRDLGFAPDGVEPNWSQTLTWPPSHAEARRTAELLTTALRVYGCETPAQLTYQAFHARGGKLGWDPDELGVLPEPA